jgi:hypothetical protein
MGICMVLKEEKNMVFILKFIIIIIIIIIILNYLIYFFWHGILKNGPLHISCHLPLENDSLSNFNLPHTYGHYFENKLIFYMIIIKILTWFTNLLQFQIHYNMNSNLKMLTKKLQLLPFVVISNE